MVLECAQQKENNKTCVAAVKQHTFARVEEKHEDNKNSHTILSLLDQIESPLIP